MCYDILCNDNWIHYQLISNIGIIGLKPIKYIYILHNQNGKLNGEIEYIVPIGEY